MRRLWRQILAVLTSHLVVIGSLIASPAAWSVSAQDLAGDNGDGSAITSDAWSEICRTCNTMALELEKYVRVMEQLIAVLDQEPPEFVERGRMLPMWWEQYMRRMWTETILSTVFVPIKTLWRTSADALPHFFSNFTNLFSSRSVMRDAQIFDEIDRQLQRKMLALGTNRSYYRPISQATLQQIDNLLQQLWYIRLRQSPSSSDDALVYNFTTSFSHNGAMLGKLYRLNEFYRDLFAKRFYTTYFSDIGRIDHISTTNPQDQLAPLLSNEATVVVVQLLWHDVHERLYKWMDNFRVSRAESTFDIDIARFIQHVWAIETEYRCSWGSANVCTDPVNMWRSGWRTGWDGAKNNFNKWFATSRTIFLDAVARLRWELWGSASQEEKLMAEQRKEALLRSQRWPEWPRDQRFNFSVNWILIDDTETTQGNPLPLSPYVQRMHALAERRTRLGHTYPEPSPIAGRSSFVDSSPNPADAIRTVTPLFNSATERYDYLETIIDEYMSATMVSPYFSSVWITTLWIERTQRIDSMVMSMQWTFRSLMSLQQELQEQALYTDGSQVTYLFPQLSMYVHKGIELIWSKNSDSPQVTSLVAWFGEMCELQCPTLPNKVCYYFKN